MFSKHLRKRATVGHDSPRCPGGRRLRRNSLPGAKQQTGCERKNAPARPCRGLRTRLHAPQAFPPLHLHRHPSRVVEPAHAGGPAGEPVYADVFHGIEQVCHEFRINLSFSSLDVVDGRLRSLPALINDERVSGIVLVGAIPRQMVEPVVASAQLTSPPLTTIRVDRRALGQIGVQRGSVRPD